MFFSELKEPETCTLWNFFISERENSYLVEVTRTASLQELFVTTHRDTECVNHLVPMMLCSGNDVTIVCVKVLDFFLGNTKEIFYF